MGATSGSIYQKVLLSHISGSPPNAYPQTSFETIDQYKNRMFSQGLPPDIGSTESDATYLSRLVSYQPPVPNGTDIFGSIAMTGPATASFAGFNCSVTRSAVGVFPVQFSVNLPSAGYGVAFQGFSGSLTGSQTLHPTASIGYALNQSTTGFTMSVFTATSPITPADVTSASFSIIG